MDIRDTFARVLEIEIGEESDILSGTTCIGNRLSDGSYRYEIYTLRVDSLVYPDHWLDNLRYELKRNKLAQESLIAEHSSTCSAARRAELISRLKMDRSTKLGTIFPNFVAVTFQLKPKHEVSVFIFSKQSTGRLQE